MMLLMKIYSTVEGNRKLSDRRIDALRICSYRTLISCALEWHHFAIIIISICNLCQLVRLQNPTGKYYFSQILLFYIKKYFSLT